MLSRQFSADYPIIDLDGHIFEDPIIFSEYLNPNYREYAKAIFSAEGGPGLANLVNGRRPGAGYKYRMGMDAGESFPLTLKEQPGLDYRFPGEADAGVRLACMDREGIDVSIIRNTNMAGIFHLPACHGKLIEELCIAYNNYLNDFCSADRNRLIPEAVLPCGNMEATMKEMERTAKMGFKSAVVRSSIASPGCPLSDKHYDPLFSCMQEMGWPLFIHAAFDPNIPSGAQLFLSPANMQSSSAGAFFNGFTGFNFMIDNIATLVEITLGGLLDKFPKLNVVFIESGHSWLGESLYRLDKAFEAPFTGMLPSENWACGMSLGGKTRPSELFDRQIYCMFEGGDRLATKEGIERIGKNLVWCSDIPHWDGEGPWEGGNCLSQVLKVNKDTELNIMGRTGARLLNVPYEKRVGTSKNTKPIPADALVGAA